MSEGKTLFLKPPRFDGGSATRSFAFNLGPSRQSVESGVKRVIRPHRQTEERSDSRGERECLFAKHFLW